MQSIVKISLATALAAGTLSLALQPAQAFTVTGGTPFSNVIDFEDVTLGPPASPTTVDGYTNGLATYSASPDQEGLVVQGNRLGQGSPAYRAPSGNSSQYLTVGSNGGQNPFSTTIDFSKPLTSFGLQWGSIDSYNTISFLKGGATLASFNGSQIVTALNNLGITATLDSGTGNASATQYVRFFANNAGEYFDQVILASSQAAFESDNHSYEAIPTPALLPGLIGLGAAAWRKRKQGAAQEA